MKRYIAFADSTQLRPKIVESDDGALCYYAEAAAEIDALKDEIKKLRAHRVLTCVYCGHEYPQGTPAAGASVLTEHIAVCEKHPMRAMKDEIDALKAEMKIERQLVAELASFNHDLQQEITRLRACLQLARAAKSIIEEMDSEDFRFNDLFDVFASCGLFCSDDGTFTPAALVEVPEDAK